MRLELDLKARFTALHALLPIRELVAQVKTIFCYWRRRRSLQPALQFSILASFPRVCHIYIALSAISFSKNCFLHTFPVPCIRPSAAGNAFEQTKNRELFQKTLHQLWGSTKSSIKLITFIFGQWKSKRIKCESEAKAIPSVLLVTHLKIFQAASFHKSGPSLLLGTWSAQLRTSILLTLFLLVSQLPPQFSTLLIRQLHRGFSFILLKIVQNVCFDFV